MGQTLNSLVISQGGKRFSRYNFDPFFGDTLAQKRPNPWKQALRALPICSGALLAMTFSSETLQAADPETEQRLKQLEQQNQALQDKLKQQQAVIDDLAKKLSKVEDKTAAATISAPDEASASKGFGFGQVRISGEGGVGVFHTSKGGQFYN